MSFWGATAACRATERISGAVVLLGALVRRLQGGSAHHHAVALGVCRLRDCKVIGPTRLYGYTAQIEHASQSDELRYIDAVRHRFYSGLLDMPVPISKYNFRHLRRVDDAHAGAAGSRGESGLVPSGSGAVWRVADRDREGCGAINVSRCGTRATLFLLLREAQPEDATRSLPSSSFTRSKSMEAPSPAFPLVGLALVRTRR